MSKSKKGYKTAGAKVAAIVVGGSILLSATGVCIFSVWNKNRKSEHVPNIKDSEITDTFVDEETIVTESGDIVEIPEDDKIMGGIETEIPTPPANTAPVSPEFRDILTKLTAEARKSIEATTGGTAKSLAITALNYIKADPATGIVTIHGEAKISDNLSNMVISVNNQQTSFTIYNLEGELTERQFIDSLNEILNAEGTTFEASVKKILQLTDQNAIIVKLLKARQATLDPADAEYAHIEAVLKDTSKAKISVLDHGATRDQNTKEYLYSFSVIVSTGKVYYSAEYSFSSTRALTNRVVRDFLEDEIDTKDAIVSANPTSEINKQLSLIDPAQYSSSQEKQTEETVNV